MSVELCISVSCGCETVSQLYVSVDLCVSVLCECEAVCLNFM